MHQPGYPLQQPYPGQWQQSSAGAEHVQGQYAPQMMMAQPAAHMQIKEQYCGCLTVMVGVILFLIAPPLALLMFCCPLDTRVVTLPDPYARMATPYAMAQPYGAPPMAQPYGAPPMAQPYGAPPMAQPYGAPEAAQQPYGAPQAAYGAPPPMHQAVVHSM